jgi:CRISPR-associated protein Cmr1
MEVILSVRTPLWTGGAEPGKMDRLHETGILGSLRWWYEAVWRGLGFEVCDPIQKPCQENHLCPACDLFGATGHRRRFRLKVSGVKRLFGDNPSERENPILLLPSGHTRPDGRQGGWYLYGQSQLGDNAQLSLTSLDSSDALSRLLVPLFLIEKHAAFGAKTSSGGGVVKIKELTPPQSSSALDLSYFKTGYLQPGDLPDLRDCFFARYIFSPPAKKPYWWKTIMGIAQSQDTESVLDNLIPAGFLPLAQAIRDFLRFQWAASWNERDRVDLFVEARSLCPRCFSVPQKTQRGIYFCRHCNANYRNEDLRKSSASRICVSHAYRLIDDLWEFRIWGWVPRLGCWHKMDRDKLIAELQKAILSEQCLSHILGCTTIALKPMKLHLRTSSETNGLDYLRDLLEANGEIK